MKKHKTNNKKVIKVEHISESQVIVTYDDLSEQMFSPAHYQRMHKDIK